MMDNRTIEQIRENETKLIKEIEVLESKLQRKYDNFPKTVKNLSKEQLESLYLDALHAENEKSKQIKQRDEDIQFCLRSIEEEMNMSKDERTRKEMKTCYEILKQY